MVSVDPPEVSRKWAQEKGFEFDLLSDPSMEAIKAWGVLNTDNNELALHAAFLVDDEKRIRYRKVARRRVAPPELLHAIDGDQVLCCPGGCGDTPKVCRPKSG